MFDTFRIHEESEKTNLPPLLLIFLLRMGVFKAHQNYVNLDGKHQVLIYVDDVNLLDVISQLLFFKNKKYRELNRKPKPEARKN
jgi:hypothetical protein